MNWKQALALGLCSVVEVKKEPVAYMYGSLRAPKLPEHSTHPYVVIKKYISSYGTITQVKALLFFMKTWEPTVYGSIYPKDALYHSPGDIQYSVSKYVSNKDDFEVSDWGEPVVLSDHLMFDTPLTWTNTDIISLGSYYYEAGAIINAASDPIPVYE